jgi:2-oxoglutarate dehydrogenase E2 component (dihydrolipoamide succinyltransferase)
MKASGSQVEADEEILELETDKVNQVVYAPASGLLNLTVNVDDVVTIGQVIGTVDSDAKGEAPAPAPAEKAAPAPAAPAAAGATEGPPARIMPAESIQSVPAAAATPKAAPAPKPAPVSAPISAPEGTTTRKRMSGLRKTIAKRLVAAKNETAMLTTFNEVDMSTIMAIRKKEQDNFVKQNGVKLGFMSFFIKAAVAALKEFPEVNSFIEGEEIVTFSTYDIGVAVSTEKGLMVPVLRGCDAMSFADVEKSLGDFAVKAREGKISIDDLRGGSFTITNGGVFGSMLSTPILNPPQSAILGMHTITKRAVVVNDQIVIRPMMYLALSYDHRIVDGKEAVQFLVHMKNNLEDPNRLLLDL